MIGDDTENGATLANDRSQPPGQKNTIPAGFVRDLFGRAPAEDLAVYPPQALAQLALRAFEHLGAVRALKTADIRLTDLDSETDGRQLERTIVEILNDNMPFLLDSNLNALIGLGYEPVLVAHPIFAVERGDDGALIRIAGEATGEDRTFLKRESLIHIHLPKIDDEASRDHLVAALEKVNADVAAAVGDWAAMRAGVETAASDYRTMPPPIDATEVDEAMAFLTWLADDNFTFLGMREYRFVDGDPGSEPLTESGYGLLRDPSVRVLRLGGEFVVMTPEIRAFLARPQPLFVAKADIRSTVHRNSHLDYIGVKLFTPDGGLAGELRIVGLFASRAFASSIKDIPLLRRKADRIRIRADLDPQSYAGRALLNVLENYPREELFHADEDGLFHAVTEIMNLSERPRVRVLTRMDPFDRYASILVFCPKDRNNAETRRKIGDCLAQAYKGRVSAVDSAYSDGPLTRLHYIIGRRGGPAPQPDRIELETTVAAIVATWDDSLGETLLQSFPGSQGRILASKYKAAFDAGYRYAFTIEDANADIAHLERLSDGSRFAVALYRRSEEDDGRIGLKVFSFGIDLPLSDRVPLLENIGFKVVNERTYRIGPEETDHEGRIWLHDMTLVRTDGAESEIDAVRTVVEEALLALFQGKAESDRFNRLILEIGFAWREAAIFRALGRYLKQIGIPYEQDYLAECLTRRKSVTEKIIALFKIRFDPTLDSIARDGLEAVIRAEIDGLLQTVSSLDDDRILRRFVNLIEATVRTDFFLTDDAGKSFETIAFKFDCAKIEKLPKPAPLYEIFVYSPRVEGTHLRFGTVARGGLRWSDRPQDFRIEALGLVKAQRVKNAVIVPVGAKGGFVPKKLPPAKDRQAWMAEGRESYRVFVRALLRLTDSIESGAVVPPKGLVRHDGDDPYLVVAADKGTATFSDTANDLAHEAGFWLDDAFASGGTHGYDHKAMGITARGAWEAVKRHFREMNVDIAQRSITAVGVGDMSGDVFGNGMLLSKTLKLVAAFDHRDIFLDPDPDPLRSWNERQRLFELPGSSWQDYDRSALSEGGGVFSRQAKTIALSLQMRALLDIERPEASPMDVMSAILRAKADLLWFGGVGAYIRSSDETDDQVGDRANDAIRITGRDVRAKVIGEGANLACTQLGRIEAAQQAGVRLNTDAIDNSGGVNASDMEVNIKIALKTPQTDGRLSKDERDTLLADMTDEVASLVLANNHRQTLTLSLAERFDASDFGFLRRLMGALEQEGRLDRKVEALPDDTTLKERAAQDRGLTRPELAVLIAYAKLSLKDVLLASEIPDLPFFAKSLERYFPTPIRERFPDAIANHRLRREIVATQLANTVVDWGGPTAVVRLADQSGSSAPAIALAFAVALEVFAFDDTRAEVDALDGIVTDAVQKRLYSELRALVLELSAWFLRHGDLSPVGIEESVRFFKRKTEKLADALEDSLPSPRRNAAAARLHDLTAAGLPESLARRLSALPDLAAAPDIALSAQRLSRPIVDIAKMHFAIEDTFAIDALTKAARTTPVTDYFDRLALERALDTVSNAHRDLVADIVSHATGEPNPVAAWHTRRGQDVEHARSAVQTIVSSGLTVSKVMVAAGLLSDLAER